MASAVLKLKQSVVFVTWFLVDSVRICTKFLCTYV